MEILERDPPTMPPHTIERLDPSAVTEQDQSALATLLVDAVDSGAAVSFLAPLSHDRALAWWRSTLASARTDPKRAPILLAARDPISREIIATVQAHPAWAPNQPHRAEVCKLIVHRQARRLGLARTLMHAIERESLAAGFTLLTLDAKKGGPAERLYHAVGWTRVGEIPRFAVDTDGRTPHATVIFSKDLNRGRDRGANWGWRERSLWIRPTMAADVPRLYEMDSDPESCDMAGTKPRTREAFMTHWEGIFANPKIIPRTIEARENGIVEIVGSVNVFQAEGLDMVGYNIARRHWGRGIATRALELLLQEVKVRPLHATTARANGASARVLERCGFRCTGSHMGEETERYSAREVASFVLE